MMSLMCSFTWLLDQSVPSRSYFFEHSYFNFLFNSHYLLSFPFATVPEDQQYRMALRWMVEAGRLNKFFEDPHTARRMADELLSAYENTGKVVRQKQELHKEAEANKAYAHFRWGVAGSNRKR